MINSTATFIISFQVLKHFLFPKTSPQSSSAERERDTENGRRRSQDRDEEKGRGVVGMADGINNHAAEASRHRRSRRLLHPRAQGPTLQVAGGVETQSQRRSAPHRPKLRPTSRGPSRQEEDRREGHFLQ